MEKLSEKLREKKRHYWSDADDMGVGFRERNNATLKAEALEEAAQLAEAYEAKVEKRIAELNQRVFDLQMALGPYSAGAAQSDLPDLLRDIASSQDNEFWDEVFRGSAARIELLQSQLTWSPVSYGLPEGETVLVRQSRSNGDYYIYGLLWNAGLSLQAVTEEQPCGLYEYGSSSEAMRDWDEFRRIEPPEEK